MDLKNITIDTNKKTISFSGLVYHEWGHIRWLRSQLEVMEKNAVTIWCDEKVARAVAKQRETTEKVTKLSVIDGGKTEEP